MYKLIQDNKVIDVVASPRFVRFLASGNIAMTDRTSAHGIVGSDEKTIYRLTSRAPSSYAMVSIQEISTVEEFNRLYGLLNSDAEVFADESPLLEARRARISSLSSQCNSIITSGFSVKLSDGELHAFKLTTEDQLNLMLIENQIANGETSFVYHATNMPCRIYSKEDMTKIVGAFRRHVLFHTTYFNAAKQYINSLTNIEKICLFKYGQDISSAVDDVVIRQLLKAGGVQE